MSGNKQVVMEFVPLVMPDGYNQTTLAPINIVQKMEQCGSRCFATTYCVDTITSYTPASLTNFIKVEFHETINGVENVISSTDPSLPIIPTNGSYNRWVAYYGSGAFSQSDTVDGADKWIHINAKLLNGNINSGRAHYVTTNQFIFDKSTHPVYARRLGFLEGRLYMYSLRYGFWESLQNTPVTGLQLNVDAPPLDSRADRNFVSANEMGGSITDIRYNGTLTDWIDSNCYVTLQDNLNRYFYFNDTLEYTAKFNADGDIRDFMYANVNQLTSVEWNTLTTSIGMGAFCQDHNLNFLSFPPNLTTIGDGAFYHCSSLENCIIPNGVSTIGNDTFNGCSSLTNVSLGNVTSIGDRAFAGCSSITTIDMPDILTTIGTYAFYNCVLLEDMNLDNVTSIAGNAFRWCRSITQFIISDEATIVGNPDFWGCHLLESVYLGASNTSIGSVSFRNCGALKEIFIYTETPPRVDTYSFQGVSASTIVYVPSDEAVTAYQNADGWRNLTIKKNDFANYAVQSESAIMPNYNKVFMDYLSNEIIQSGNVETHMSISDASSVQSLIRIQNATYEIESLDELRYFTGLTTFPVSFAYNCKSLKSAIIPEGVVSLGNYIFFGCSALANVILPSTLQTIPLCAFINNIFTHIDIPNGVQTIGSYAFQNMVRLPSIILPSSLTSIDTYCFLNCGIQTIDIPQNVTSIGNGAFSTGRLTSITSQSSNFIVSNGNLYSSDMKRIVVKPQVTGDVAFTVSGDIEDISGAFYYDNTIENVTFNAKLTEIGSSSFSRAKKLQSVTIPSTVRTIDTSAFAYINSSLTSIELGELNQSSALLLTINAGAFRSDANVQQIISHYITPPTVSNENAFEGVNKNIPVYVERESSIDEYESATGWSLFTNYWPIHVVQTFDNTDVMDYNREFMDFLIGWGIVPSGTNDIQIWDARLITTFGNHTIGNGTITSLRQMKYFGLTELPSRFVYNNSSITEIAFPPTLSEIPSECCSWSGSGHRNLVSVEIPEGNEVIGYRAFRYCGGLTSVTIPSTCNSIGNEAFSYCSALTELHCLAAVPPTIGGTNTFAGIKTTLKVYVPVGSRDSYVSSSWVTTGGINVNNIIEE